MAAVDAAGLKPTKTGPDFHIQCPAHGERTPSLHVTYRPADGRVFLHCFGCLADEQDLAEALGLGLVDLFDQAPECKSCGGGTRHTDSRDCHTWGKTNRRPAHKPTPQQPKPRRRLGPLPKPLGTEGLDPDHDHQLHLVTTYDYFDHQGTLVQQVQRHHCTECGHKEFRQAFVTRSGKLSTRKPAGFTAVLYRLPEVLDAVAHGRPVVLVEGEKDADTAAALGAAGTTNPQGSGAFAPELAAVLVGADVRVVLDRDGAGYRRGAELHQLLTETRARVRLFLPRPEAAKADLTDHVDAGHALSDLLEVTVEEVRAWALAEAAAAKACGPAGVTQCAVEARLQAEQAAAKSTAPKAAAQHQANARRWAAESVRRHDQLTSLVTQQHAGAGFGTAWGTAARARLSEALEQAQQAVRDAHTAAGLTPPAPSADADTAPAFTAQPTVEVDNDEPSNVVDHPTRARQQESFHPIAMSRGVWMYDTGDGDLPRGIYTTLSGQWLKVAPLPYVRARIVRRDGTGRRCGTDYLLAVDESDSPGVIVDHLKLRDGSWANDLGLPLSDDDKIGKAASTAIRQYAEDAPLHEATPRVDDDGQVAVPVPDTLPTGYLRTAPCDRQEGLEAWAQIIRLSASSPRIALTLGASAIAPFIKALDRQSHFVALYGDPNLGKTITLSLAACIWGKHNGGVLQSWNTSAPGIGRFLGSLGVLPPFLDEAGMNRTKGPSDWGRLIYELCEGSQRMVAESRGPGVRISGRWDGILFSSGNGRMTAELGAGPFAGVAKRVVDLVAPFTHSVEQAAQLKPLRVRAFGHAGAEILDRYDVARAGELVQAAAARIGWPAGQTQRTMADHLHSHVAGAAMLDEIAGTGTLLQDAAAQAAVEHLSEWAEPEHDADRITRQVLDSIAREPAMWPTVSEYLEHRQPKPDFLDGRREGGRVTLPQHGINRELRGIRDDDDRWVAVFAQPWKEFCGADEIDQSVACRELHARGVLLVPPSSRRSQQWTTQMKATGTRMYKLDLTALGSVDAELDGAGPVPPATDTSPVPPPRETATQRIAGQVADPDPDGCGSVAGEVAGTNAPLTCEVAGVAGVAGSNPRTHAHEEPVPIPSDREAEPDVAPPALPEGETGDLMRWSFVEFVDRDGNRRHSLVAPLAPCLGCGLPSNARIDGQPWHGVHWETTTTADRARLSPAPVPGPQPDAAERRMLAAHRSKNTPRQSTRPPAPEPTTSARPAAAPAQRSGFAAAVVDIDAVWLPDGSSRPLPYPIEHLGHLEQLGRDLGLSVPAFKWRKTPGAGQVVPTRALWDQLGVPVHDVPAGHRQRARWLADVSADLRALTDAAAAGWVFGRGDGPPRLRGVIRLRAAEADRGSIAVIYAPAFDAKLEVLTADLPPSQLARRLQLFADTVGIPFTGSPISTAMDLLDIVMPKKHRDRWEPVDFSDIEPAWSPNLESDFDWSRVPAAGESALRYAHYYDRNGSYLAACSSTLFGVGAPEHHAEGMPFDRKRAGWWRIEIPPTGNRFVPNLLDPKGEAAGRQRWVTTAALDYAVANLDVHPQVLEAWVWPAERSARLLEPWYKVLAEARRDLLRIGDDDAHAVEKLLKLVYKQVIGHFISENALGSSAHNPYWHHAIKAAARVAVLHTVLSMGQQTGTWPLAVANTDAVLYASDDPDPVSAWPGRNHSQLAAKLGTQLGGFKPYRSGLLADQLPMLNGTRFTGRDTLTDVRQWNPDGAEE